MYIYDIRYVAPEILRGDKYGTEVHMYMYIYVCIYIYIYIMYICMYIDVTP
jgi:hypothetical protein